MDQIVSQLLAELNGISSGDRDGITSDIFVISTTNRPDLLNPALLCPSRFDELFYLGVRDTDEVQLHILGALMRNFHLDPALELLRVTQDCPFNFTGTDFYTLCTVECLGILFLHWNDYLDGPCLFFI